VSDFSPEVDALLAAAGPRRPRMGTMACPWCKVVGRASTLYFSVSSDERWTLDCDDPACVSAANTPVTALPRRGWLDKSTPEEAA